MYTQAEIAAGSTYGIVGYNRKGKAIYGHTPINPALIPPEPPAPQAVPKPPLRISKTPTMGVKRNTKTKNKSKNNLRIGRSANVQPLQAGAVGYTGLRIS